MKTVCTVEVFKDELDKHILNMILLSKWKHIEGPALFAAVPDKQLSSNIEAKREIPAGWEKQRMPISNSLYR